MSVTWAVYPKSFWRKLLLARARRPVLAAEVKASLDGLAAHLHPAAAAPELSR